MPKKKILSLRCPSCGKLVLRDEPDFPFCSERCRVVDLGKWATGGYVISSPVTDPEDVEAIADHERRKVEAQADEQQSNHDPRRIH